MLFVLIFLFPFCIVLALYGITGRFAVVVFSSIEISSTRSFHHDGFCFALAVLLGQALFMASSQMSVKV